MATMIKTNHLAEESPCFYIVHPLDDVAEEKRNPDHLGPMPMSPSVRLSLMALRGYLILMSMLVLYHVLDLAGLFGHVLK